LNLTGKFEDFKDFKGEILKNRYDQIKPSLFRLFMLFVSVEFLLQNYLLKLILNDLFDYLLSKSSQSFSKFEIIGRKRLI